MKKFLLDSPQYPTELPKAKSSNTILGASSWKSQRTGQFPNLNTTILEGLWKNFV